MSISGNLALLKIGREFLLHYQVTGDGAVTVTLVT
jgi:hypothetical protein